MSYVYVTVWCCHHVLATYSGLQWMHHSELSWPLWLSHSVPIVWRSATSTPVQGQIFSCMLRAHISINHAHVIFSLSLSVNNVVYLTGFPLEVENNVQIVFGVGISSEQAVSSPAFIPASQLVSIMLINHASLQTKAGSFLGQITLYYEVSIFEEQWNPDQ